MAWIRRTQVPPDLKGRRPEAALATTKGAANGTAWAFASPRNGEDEARDLALTPRNAVTKERKRCNLLKTCYFVGFSILRRAPVFCFCIYVGRGVSVLQLSLGTLASLIPEINRPTEKERCMRLVW